MVKKITSVEKTKKMVSLTLELPEELKSQLEHLEKTTGKSKEFLFQEALTQYLEDAEDLYIALKTKNKKLYTTKELLDSLKPNERRSSKNV